MRLSLYNNKRNRKHRITMKTYAYIFILTLFVLVHSGCRTNRNLSESSVRDAKLHSLEQSNTNTSVKETTNSTLDKTIASNTQENAESVSETAENKQVDEFEKKEEIKEEFDENGNLKSRTTTNTRKGRTERSTSGGRTHDASNRSYSSVGSDKQEETKETDVLQQTEIKSDVELVDHEEIDKEEDTSSDSRWIQGKEWWAVIIPIAVVCGIVYLIRNGRKKRNNNSNT